MKKALFLLIATTLLSPAYAMDALSDEDLKMVQGQAGADLSLKLSLNQKYDATKGKYVLDDVLCKDVEYCRLAVSVNNR